jgi:hypothetical protein
LFYIQGFKSVFETGIRYYSIKKGINILFKKDNNGDTPCQYACKRFEYEQVMNVIEDALVHSSSSSSSSDNITPSINIVEALVMAAIDESIHLDCVYFLLRRQPDLLVKLL